MLLPSISLKYIPDRCNVRFYSSTCMFVWFRMYVNSVMVKDVLPVYSETVSLLYIPLVIEYHLIMYRLIIYSL